MQVAAAKALRIERRANKRIAPESIILNDEKVDFDVWSSFKKRSGTSKVFE